jgi:hypothetical protein
VTHEQDLHVRFLIGMTALLNRNTKAPSPITFPIYILIDTQVYAEYQTFQKNKDNKNITYAHVDSVNIFHLLEEILLQRRNNAMSTFSRYTEIEDWLREQWAGFFRELLKRTTQSQEIASLSSQVSELSELNKTLRTYLETLITSISPEESKAIIETESTRLEERQKQAAINDNRFIRFLQDDGKIAPEVARKIIESSPNLDRLIEKIHEFVSPGSADMIEDTLRRMPAAQTDLNDVRQVLGKPSFRFTERPEINDDSDSVSETDVHQRGKRVKAPAATSRRAAVD